MILFPTKISCILVYIREEATLSLASSIFLLDEPIELFTYLVN